MGYLFQCNAVVFFVDDAQGPLIAVYRGARTAVLSLGPRSLLLLFVCLFV